MDFALLAWTKEFYRQTEIPFRGFRQKVFSSHYPEKCVSQKLEIFFYLEHGIVHKVVVLLIRPLCCQKVCLLTQKQSFAAVVTDQVHTRNQIFSILELKNRIKPCFHPFYPIFSNPM